MGCAPDNLLHMRTGIAAIAHKNSQKKRALWAEESRLRMRREIAAAKRSQRKRGFCVLYARNKQGRRAIG